VSKSFSDRHPVLAAAGMALGGLWLYRRYTDPEQVSKRADDKAFLAERARLVAEQQAAGAEYNKQAAAEAAGYKEYSEWEAAKQASDDYWAEHNRKAAELQAERARKAAEDAKAMAEETARLHAEYEAKQQEKKGAKARGRYE